MKKSKPSASTPTLTRVNELIEAAKINAFEETKRVYSQFKNRYDWNQKVFDEFTIPETILDVWKEDFTQRYEAYKLMIKEGRKDQAINEIDSYLNATDDYKIEDSRPNRGYDEGIDYALWMNKFFGSALYYQGHSLLRMEFNQHFESKTVIKPIWWKDSARLLGYLLEELAKVDLIDKNSNINQLIKEHFIDKDMKSFKKSIKQNRSGTNSNKTIKPKGHMKIDKIIKNLKV